MTRIRVAVQWLRHSNNITNSTYECAVLDLRVPPYGETYEPALVKVLVGKPYSEYVEGGGTLSYEEYIDLVLLDENNDVTSYSGSLDYQVTQSRVVTGDFVGVRLSFSAPNLDLIG